MGRLQDNQYGSSARSRYKTQKSPNGKDELMQRFCPPLDPTLIEAIWNDGQQYDTCVPILTELAREADKALEIEQVQAVAAAACTDEREDSKSTSIDNSNCSSDDGDVQQNLDFLMVCFPAVSRAALLQTLEEQDNNVGSATDILLNDAYLESDVALMSENSTNSSNGEDDELSYQTALRLDRMEKRRAKKKAEKKDKGVIWSTGKLPLASSSSMLNDQENGLTALPTTNAWSQYDGQVDDIHKAFPAASRIIILGCVKQCHGNVIASVRQLMRKNPRLKPVLPWAVMSEMDQVKDAVKAIIMDRSPEEIHRIVTGVIVASANSSDDGAAAKPTVEKMTQTACDFALTFDRHQQELAERMALLRIQKSDTTATTDLPAVPEYLLIDNVETYKEDDPETCRDNAIELITHRNALFRKAAEAYRRTKNKGPGEGGIAFYYSNEARQLDDRAKNWNLRAARALVRDQRIREQDDHLVDLHGLTVAEAQVLLKEAVNQWWSRSQMQIGRRGIKPLKIVTGVGKHSQYGESKLLPSALKLLKRDGWRTEVPYPGRILVKGPTSANQ
ncbi:hypothetical protein BDB00DRAFT_885193 [Zychaea mexicana]|uniref:uncharacterized protein n=1 Tax=Zychaea mexicana TaxID=64656 RepID=UPI0022FDBCCB|nr:uncharacterized protein BDB00DRAFT_885193 [Zychaea mexicana]KAI9484664.1 hypothetical protein BDB00DRAFT_885193 [Zychaea mexicana]